MPTKIDPRFNPLAGVSNIHLRGTKVTPAERIQKARIIASRIHEKMVSDAEQQELDSLHENIVNRTDYSETYKKRDKEQKRKAILEAEHQAIANKIADIVFDAVPFDESAKFQYEKSLKESTSNFIMALFEHKVINDFQFSKNPSMGVKKLILSLFDENMTLREEADDLQKDISDAIKMKAQELIKKEIENAKVSDTVEDDIHDQKTAEGDIEGGDGDQNAPEANNVPAEGNAPGETNTGDVSASTTVDNPEKNAQQNTPAPNQNTEEDNSENSNDAFGIGEDYLDLRHDLFHVGKSRHRPAFQNKLFGRLLTESCRQIIKSTGKSDPEKALGNATALFCIYETCNHLNLINDNNADTIYNALIQESK